jgi:chromosome segregation ATPase
MMNDPVLEESKRLGETANRLFSGFNKKLAAMRSEALDLHQRIEAYSPEEGPSSAWKRPTNSKEQELNRLVRHYQTVYRQFESLEPALSKFARQISQRLEHTDIDETVRIELEVRLADFENEIRTTRDYITNYLP